MTSLFFHNQHLLAVDLHLGARPLAEQHAVALGFSSSGTILLPSSPRAPGPTAMTSPCWGFSRRSIGMMMPPAVLVSPSSAAECDAIVEGTKFHGCSNANRPACAEAFGEFWGRILALAVREC